MNQHIMIEPEAQALEREELLETEMTRLGLGRFQRALEQARANGKETETPGAKLVMQSTIEPMAAAITTLLKQGDKRRGRKLKAFAYLSKLPTDVAAFLTAKVILDSVTLRLPIMKTALAIGSALEDEERFANFADQEPVLFKTLRDDLVRRTSNKDWWRRVIVHEMTEADISWEAWAASDKVHLGMQCIHLFIQATGMVHIVYAKKGKNNTHVYLEPSEECLALIVERNKRCELLSPALMPTVVPPKPWAGTRDGGYWFLTRPLPFIKTHNRSYLKEVENNPSTPRIYQAVNAMQETAWRVNGPVLKVLRHVWDNALPLGGLSFRVEQALPPCPACKGVVDPKSKDHDCFNDDKGALTEWKRAASKVHTLNGKNRSKQLQVAKVLWVAEKFKEDAAMYFPTQLDFRGRAYSVPMFLNPQGADWAKGLLTFAHGKPITDDRAAGWLMIHGANTYGFGKVSLEDRIGWVEENEADILACAEDPLGHTFWSDADKPWQFLAFCFEYAGFKEHGMGFVSSLPVALDGSCNGLQHFSAMLRDPIGGAAVNLLPSDKPNDIYQTVCDRLIEKLKASSSPMAAQWLSLKLDRKLTKRPVMTLPYGSTMFSCREYVADWLSEQQHGWGEDTLDAELFCTKLIWQSIGETVVAARQAMDWLQKAARAASKDLQPVRWTAPDGLLIEQAYFDLEKYQVRTQLGERVMKLWLRRETGKLDKRRQANGISPNFVHSMDAAALRLYVLLANDRGISSFALVHDSYGTLAADTDMSAACLREAFMGMYQDRNYLEELRTSLARSVSDPAKLPVVPTMGSLNLGEVKNAEYFFA